MVKNANATKQGRGTKRTAVGSGNATKVRNKISHKKHGFSEMPQAAFESTPFGDNSSTPSSGFETSRLREELTATQKSLASTSAAFEALNAENANLRKRAREAEREISRVKELAEKAITSAATVSMDSFPNRVGTTMINHLKSPQKIPILPYRLWKSYKNYTNELELGTIQSISDVRDWFRQNTRNSAYRVTEISKADIEQMEDLGELRRVFWPAFRSLEFRLCHQIIERVKKLISTETRPGEDKYLLKMIEKMPAEYPIIEAASVVPDPDYKPIRNKVCYALHNSLPYSSGGYATRARGLATAFSAAGFSLHLITRPGFPFDYKPELTDAEVPEKQTIEGLTYHRLLNPKRNKYKIAEYMRLAADAFEAKFRDIRPSLVIAASNYHTGFPAMIAARRLGIPFVYEVRGFWEITRISRDPSFINHPSYSTQEFMEAELCNQADQVFTLTNAMRTELVRRGVERDKIELLPNACNPEKFKPTRRSTSLAKRYDIPTNVPVIGYIGSFVQYEGLENLSEACGILKARGLEFRLMIVGNENVSGDEMGPIATGILKNAELGDISDWIIMPGRIPHEEVPDHYSLVDIAVFPRKPQPVTEMVSPIKPLEAMSMSKPILVSGVDAMAEMVIPGETGLVFEKGNVHSMANEMQKLIEDPKLRKKLGANARKWVGANRSWNSVAKSAIPLLKIAGKRK